MRKEGVDVPFPGWDRLKVESLESESRVLIMVSDSDDHPVRWIEASNKKGTHRVSWDLRLPAPDAIDLSTPEFVPPWEGTPQGPLVTPGRFSAQLFAIDGGKVLPLGEKQSFEVKPVRSAPDGIDYAEVARYQQQTGDLMRRVAHAGEELKRTQDLLRHMKAAALNAPRATSALFTRLDAFGAELNKLKARLSGDPVRSGLNESTSPSIGGRAYYAANTWQTTRIATATQKSDFDIAQTDFAAFSTELETLLANDLAGLEADLLTSGAPSWR